MTTGNGHVTNKWLIGIMTGAIGFGVIMYLSDQADDRRDNAARLLRIEARQNQTDIDVAAMRADLAYIRVTLLEIKAELGR